MSAGLVFVDVSGFLNDLPELRVAGWSVVVFTSGRVRIARFYGAVPRREGPSQTSKDGEDYAIYQASQLVMGTWTL